ncbi:MAG: hypothetical protein ACK5NG_01175 [Chthoniobacterales bacterium]
MTKFNFSIFKFVIIALLSSLVLPSAVHAQPVQSDEEMAAEVAQDAASEGAAPVIEADADVSEVKEESLPDSAPGVTPQMRLSDSDPVLPPAPAEETVIETERSMELIPLPGGMGVFEEDEAFIEMPQEPSAPEDFPFPEPDLIPPPLDPADLAEPGAAPQKTELEIAQEYKTLRIKIDKDPEVRSLAAQAASARTDEAKRQARRAYYRLLFSKMRKADKSLTLKIDTMESSYLTALQQSRLEPSLPLNPPPTPNP